MGAFLPSCYSQSQRTLKIKEIDFIDSGIEPYVQANLDSLEKASNH